jgi:hypothetical protein
MSSPPNALDVYRTYSYHHILLIADSTSTAEKLSAETELSRFDHPDARFLPQTHEKGGQYIVLVNGMSDSQFIVQSAKWSSVPLPTTGATTATKISSVQTMAVDGEIEIVEPQGVNFMNILANATRMMQIDPSMVVFVLKTVFVGHQDDGNVSMISNIKPLLFMMVDITSNIDVTGSTYNMSLVGVVNGAAKLPHVNAIVNGLTFNVSGTLEKTFKLLEIKLKNLDTAMRVALDDNTCGVTINPNEFIEVEYKFHLEDKYKGYKAGTNLDDKFKNLSDEGGYISNLGDMASVESIISAIMMSSLDVVKEAKGKLPDNRFMFKITSNIDTSDKEKYVVHYNIHRYKAVVIEAEKFQTFDEPERDNTGITFDYIFTGKNIDVLDLDIKMEYGLMFFQVMAAQGTTPTSAMHLLNHYNSDVSVKASGAAKVFADTGVDKKNIIKRPLFLGTTVNSPLFRDTKFIGASASFNTMLTRHAAIETLGVKMKIRGNPQLLADTTQLPEDISTIISDVPQATKKSVIIPPNGDPNVVDNLRQIMPQIHKTPAYVKVKIWSPKTWTGSAERTNEELAGSFAGDYSENLWYNGWYYMIQIDNEFSDGTFTQDLELISLPTELSEDDSSQECVDETYTRQAKAFEELENNQGEPAKKGNEVILASDIDVPKSTNSATEQRRQAMTEQQGATADSKINLVKN